MKLVWVLGDNFDAEETIGAKAMKDVGPLWGTPRSWRKNSTDNVVSTDRAQVEELLRRAFQAVCNFYIPVRMYGEVGRPAGVKVFEGVVPGDFAHHSLATVFHLVAPLADTVLLAGVSLAPGEPHSDQSHFVAAVATVIRARPEVQWVCLDHSEEVAPVLKDAGNLWFDTTENITATLKIG
jgi:hypothetical protein